MKRRFSPNIKPWRWILSLVVAIGVSALLAFTVLAASPKPAGQSAAAKLAKLHQVDAQATAAAKSWHAPKIKPSAANSGPASCPRSSLPTGIYYGDTGGFHDYITDDAVSAPAASQPFEYLIFAGAYAANPQQGLLIVARMNADPCASHGEGVLISYFATPAANGAVTLTQIAGDEVTFTTATGDSGQFNFVSGRFR